VTARGTLPGLECRGLRKRFGEIQAVAGVDFQVEEGETYGLLGPNGAGKTTIISIVCGLLKPDGGEVEVAGRRMTTASVQTKTEIGLVPQALAVYPDLTGRENLRFLDGCLSSDTTCLFGR
jgi:ABC-2 type transport system ATP-binding protein